MGQDIPHNITFCRDVGLVAVGTIFNVFSCDEIRTYHERIRSLLHKSRRVVLIPYLFLSPSGDLT